MSLTLEKKSGTRKKRRGRKKRAVPGRLSRRSAQALAPAVRLAAIECDSMAEAAVRLARQDLAEILVATPELAAAWKRGRLLRDLRQFAAAGVTMAEAGAAMALPPGSLEKLLGCDAEAGETWTRARLATVIAVKQSLVTQAREGKSAAIRQIEQVLLREIEQGKPDLRRLSLAQLMEITGKTRQTIYEWLSPRNGCPRNADRSFDLRSFLAWFEQFVARKLAGGRLPQAASARLDPLKTVKAEKLEMDLAARRGELLERGAVMAGILARQQVIVNALHRLPDDLPPLLVSQPAEAIRRTLREATAEAKRAMCEVPPQLQLPEEAAERFGKLLEELRPEGEAKTANVT